jgi:hypothetical protein
MAEDENPDQELDAQAEMAKMLTSVKDMALYNLSVVSSQAWHHLGLVPIPGTGEVKVDLEQAKLAIDLYEANLNIVSQFIDDDLSKQLKQALADMQLNYVNKSA